MYICMYNISHICMYNISHICMYNISHIHTRLTRVLTTLMGLRGMCIYMLCVYMCVYCSLNGATIVASMGLRGMCIYMLCV